MNTHRTACLAFIVTIAVLGARSRIHAQLAPAGAASCGAGAFLIWEQGRLVGVDWVQRRGLQLHSRSVLTQSLSIDATIDLRSDETASHSSVVVTIAGAQAGKPAVRDLEASSVYWSDNIVSSVEQVVARARVLGQEHSTIPTANLYHDAPATASVERIDPTDWIVSMNNKQYLVLTTEQGCMLSATLPEHGVVIERRPEFAESEYPLWAPYAARPNGRYRAEEVRIAAPAGHVLAGTLTTPIQGGSPFPAAVLITGLGPSNRNGGQPPWMPLRDIADALSNAGVAVLRVDDRGVGESTGDHAPSTTFDEADDVRTEVAWLRSRSNIDPHRVVLVGYSEGGLIAPMVAADDPLIAAIVTLAGPGTSGADLSRYQSAQVVLHNPSIAPRDRDAAIKKQLADDLKDLTPRESVVLTIEPLKYASHVHCPALILQGGSDLHVPVRSAERLANAMRGNGNQDVTVRIVPGVSHSLLPDPVGLNSGWATLPGFWTAPDLLDLMSTWTADKLKVEHGPTSARKGKAQP